MKGLVLACKPILGSCVIRPTSAFARSGQKYRLNANLDRSGNRDTAINRLQDFYFVDGTMQPPRRNREAQIQRQNDRVQKCVDSMTVLHEKWKKIEETNPDRAKYKVVPYDTRGKLT